MALGPEASSLNAGREALMHTTASFSAVSRRRRRQASEVAGAGAPAGASASPPPEATAPP